MKKIISFLLIVPFIMSNPTIAYSAAIKTNDSNTIVSDSTQNNSYYVFYKDIDTKAIDEEAELKRQDYINSLYETETDQNEVDRKSTEYYQKIRLEMINAAYKSASDKILKELGVDSKDVFCSVLSPLIICSLNEEQLNIAKNSPNITEVTLFKDFELPPETELDDRESIIQMFTTDKDGKSVLGEGIKTDVIFNSGPKKDTDYLIVYGLSDVKEIQPLLDRINNNTLYKWESPIEVEPYSGNTYYLMNSSIKTNNPINMIIFVDDVIPGISLSDISDYSNAMGFDAAPYVISLGDTNGDYIVDGRDASYILSIYAKTSTDSGITLSKEEVKKMDVNKDGIVDGIDSSFVLSYYAYISTDGTGLLSQFVSRLSGNTKKDA